MGTKCVFKHQNLQMFDLICLKQNNMHNFHPLEVVDRGSETQLQMGENQNKLGPTLAGEWSSVLMSLKPSKMPLKLIK